MTYERILIGYSMRSGSTLLQHILNQHSRICSFSDLSACLAFAKILAGMRFNYHVCVKPMDVIFLGRKRSYLRYFDKFLWLARDPRDSYLSSLESGYAYLFWQRGRQEHGIDVGLLKRWRRVYRHYFGNEHVWHLVKYEDLVADPDRTLASLLTYLNVPVESLLPFDKFKLVNGGDYKLRNTRTVQNSSVGRYLWELDVKQLKVFERYLSPEMEKLGYLTP